MSLHLLHEFVGFKPRGAEQADREVVDGGENRQRLNADTVWRKVQLEMEQIIGNVIVPAEYFAE